MQITIIFSIFAKELVKTVFLSYNTYAVCQKRTQYANLKNGKAQFNNSNRGIAQFGLR